MCECVYVCVLYDMILILLLILILILLILLQLLQLLQLLLLPIGFWTVISPFIDPVTKDKVRFLRVAKEKMIKVLSDDINPDHVEDGLGGNDIREFDSTLYLKDFNKCFNTLCDEKLVK